MDDMLVDFTVVDKFVPEFSGIGYHGSGTDVPPKTYARDNRFNGKPFGILEMERHLETPSERSERGIVISRYTTQSKDADIHLTILCPVP